MEHEWIMAGHPFTLRCAHSAFATGSLTGPYESPVFLLFLDCVWQVRYSELVYFIKLLDNAAISKLFWIHRGIFNIPIRTRICIGIWLVSGELRKRTEEVPRQRAHGIVVVVCESSGNFAHLCECLIWTIRFGFMAYRGTTEHCKDFFRKKTFFRFCGNECIYAGKEIGVNQTKSDKCYSIGSGVRKNCNRGLRCFCKSI